MDFGFSEEQQMLRKSARDFLAKECPMTYVRRMMDDDIGHSEEVWRKMAELGWMGLVFPESAGGAGLDMVDLVVVLEEMGRVVLPGPFFSTVVLAGITLAEAASDEQKKRWLRKIATGEIKATLATLEPSGRYDATGIETTAKADAGGYLLEGTKLFVPDAHVADLVIVPARKEGSSGEAGISLFAVETPKDGVTVTALATLDQTRKLCEVRLDNVRVGPESLIGSLGGGWKLLERVLDRAKVALSAEMCGGAERVLDMSVEYAKVRVQFDRPIGSFQAIQHQIAVMAENTALARSASESACAARDFEWLALASAKVCAGEAAGVAAAIAHAVHGAIGFTHEHTLHLWTRRLWAWRSEFGNSTHWSTLIGRTVCANGSRALWPAITRGSFKSEGALS